MAFHVPTADSPSHSSPMKHRNLAEATINALNQISQGEVASRVVEATVSAHPKWGKRDRNEFSHAVYEIVRGRRLLEFASQNSDSWSLLGAFLIRQNGALPSWPELGELDAAQIQSRLNQPDLPRAIRESVSDWLDEYGAVQLGERWDAEIHALNQEAPVVIRVNTLLSSRDEVRRELERQNIESSEVEGVPDALQLAGRPKLQSLEMFRRGAFEVQDAASQLVAPFLEIEPGQNIVDACAGAGGKTLHIAALMGNEGKLLALDVSQPKLDELERRARRATAHVVAHKVTKQLLRDSRAFADRLLLDMPCSGSGTWRRQPDNKDRFSAEFLHKLTALQADILEQYPLMLRPGGKMVYATCSIFPDENERQVEMFLAQNPGFEVEEARTISPAQSGSDGFYIARLVRR